LKDLDFVVAIIPSTLQLGTYAIGFVCGKRISTRSRRPAQAAQMIGFSPNYIVKTNSNAIQ
jgi:hypothetical protein